MKPDSFQPSTRTLGAVPIGTRVPRTQADRLGIPSTAIGIRLSVVLFLSPGCAPCLKLAELLQNQNLGRNPGDHFELVVVSNQTGAEQFGHIGRTVVDPKGTLAKSLGVPGTPFGIAVDSHRVIRRLAIPHVAEDVKVLADAQALTPTDGLAGGVVTADNAD